METLILYPETKEQLDALIDLAEELNINYELLEGFDSVVSENTTI